MSETLFASEVLSRLPSAYSEVVTFLEADAKIGDLDYVKERIKTFYDRKTIMKKSKKEGSK
jgi:hypothetical protein